MIGYYKLPHSPEQWSQNVINVEVDNNSLKYQLKIVNSMDSVCSQRRDPPQPSEYYYENEVTLDRLLRCSSTNKQIDQPHSVIGVGHRINDKVRNYDFFRHSYPTKTTTHHAIAAQLGIQQGFYLIRPWADTPLSEWKLYMSADTITINGVEQSKDNTLKMIDGNGLTDILKLMPSIDLKLENNKVKVQLLEPSGEYAYRSGIEVYLETTSGLLQETVLITDALGYAETELMLHKKGKVKVGFKFFSGIKEVSFGEY